MSVVREAKPKLSVFPPNSGKRGYLQTLTVLQVTRITPRLSTMYSLSRRGSSRHHSAILLIGETGVGELDFIANVLTSNNIDRDDFGILDRSNGQYGLGNQSQTNSSRFYKPMSENGMVPLASISNTVRLLERGCLVLKSEGVGSDQLQKGKDSSEHIKRKLEPLNNARDNVRKERVEIGSQNRFRA